MRFHAMNGLASSAATKLAILLNIIAMIMISHTFSVSGFVLSPSPATVEIDALPPSICLVGTYFADLNLSYVTFTIINPQVVDLTVPNSALWLLSPDGYSLCLDRGLFPAPDEMGGQSVTTDFTLVLVNGSSFTSTSFDYLQKLPDYISVEPNKSSVSGDVLHISRINTTYAEGFTLLQAVYFYGIQCAFEVYTEDYAVVQLPQSEVIFAGANIPSITESLLLLYDNSNVMVATSPFTALNPNFTTTVTTVATTTVVTTVSTTQPSSNRIGIEKPLHNQYSCRRNRWDRILSVPELY